MRQVFSSARLETVEGVAALLNTHGIDTWISNDRSYKGTRRRRFSYRDNGKDAVLLSAVWVVRSDDQYRARELLRDAGLIESTRASYLPTGALPAVKKPASRPASRIRLGLLLTVAVLATVTGVRRCQSPPSPAEPERHIIELGTSGA